MGWLRVKIFALIKVLGAWVPFGKSTDSNIARITVFYIFHHSSLSSCFRLLKQWKSQSMSRLWKRKEKRKFKDYILVHNSLSRKFYSLKRFESGLQNFSIDKTTKNLIIHTLKIINWKIYCYFLNMHRQQESKRKFAHLYLQHSCKIAGVKGWLAPFRMSGVLYIEAAEKVICRFQRTGFNRTHSRGANLSRRRDKDLAKRFNTKRSN